MVWTSRAVLFQSSEVLPARMSCNLSRKTAKSIQGELSALRPVERRTGHHLDIRSCHVHQVSEGYT